MSYVVFDIETVPDIAAGKQLLSLSNLPDAEIAAAMYSWRRQETGHDFLPHYLQQIVAISVVWQSTNQFKVYSLGTEACDEPALLQRFFDGINTYQPTLISWNGSGFDLPVIHYRALKHKIPCNTYWEVEKSDFKYNNYLNRYHYRHTDLMDVLGGFQSKAPLDNIATLLGLPGKMGMHGSLVWEYYQKGEIAAIRNYCETDVLNTYLVFLRFELIRGKLSEEQFYAACERVKIHLKDANKPHLSAFLQAWQENDNTN